MNVARRLWLMRYIEKMTASEALSVMSMARVALLGRNRPRKACRSARGRGVFLRRKMKKSLCGRGVQSDQPAAAQEEINADPGVLQLPDDQAGKKENNEGNCAVMSKPFCCRAGILPEKEGRLQVSGPVERQIGKQADHGCSQQESFPDGIPGNGQPDADRQNAGKQDGKEELQKVAQCQTQEGSGSAEQEDHEREVDQDEPAGGPEGLHDGYGVRVFPQQGVQGCLDADAGKQQGEDADQVEEKEKIFKESLYPGFGAAKGPDIFLALDRRGGQFDGQTVNQGGVGHFQEPVILDAAPFSDQVQLFQVGGGNENSRSKGKKGHRPVRLFQHHIGDGQHG
jgi:hypothetical protein